MKAGFSLVEMTIALAIVLVVTGAIFAVMNPAYGAFHSQPEAIDMQQRLRVSVEAIANDLTMAGAGTGKYFPAVLPIRRGPIAGDSTTAFFNDRASLLYAPVDAGQTTLAMPTDAGTMLYVASTNGFVPNVLVVVFDETGAYDTLRVTAIQDAPPALVHPGGALSKTYAIGANVARVVSATYWLRADTASGASELMRYDGWQSDMPVSDDVTGLAFEYFGDPSPPVLRKALDESDGPWTSYGPKPPEIDVDDPSTLVYGAGENCTFAVIDGSTVSRPEMINLGSSSLVRLTASQLTDGPWCPDPADSRRYDADLLRIRRVRITLRVRASRTFFHPLPDRQSIFDVTPRNLSLEQ